MCSLWRQNAHQKPTLARWRRIFLQKLRNWSERTESDDLYRVGLVLLRLLSVKHNTVVGPDDRVRAAVLQLQVVDAFRHVADQLVMSAVMKLVANRYISEHRPVSCKNWNVNSSNVEQPDGQLWTRGEVGLVVPEIALVVALPLHLISCTVSKSAPHRALQGGTSRLRLDIVWSRSWCVCEHLAILDTYWNRRNEETRAILEAIRELPPPTSTILKALLNAFTRLNLARHLIEDFHFFCFFNSIKF